MLFLAHEPGVWDRDPQPKMIQSNRPQLTSNEHRWSWVPGTVVTVPWAYEAAPGGTWDAIPPSEIPIGLIVAVEIQGPNDDVTRVSVVWTRDPTEGPMRIANRMKRAA